MVLVNLLDPFCNQHRFAKAGQGGDERQFATLL